LQASQQRLLVDSNKAGRQYNNSLTILITESYKSSHASSAQTDLVWLL
jgi:hypothetical protein